MSFFSFDPEKVTENRGTFQPLPIGEYEVVISEVEVGESAQKKTPQIKMTLTVREDVEQPGKKRKIFQTLYFTEKTVEMNQRALKAMGVGAANFETIVDVAKAIQYKAVRVKIKHEEYEKDGETKITERVHYYNPTQYPIGSAAPSKDPFAGGPPANIGDEDLPF